MDCVLDLFLLIIFIGYLYLWIPILYQILKVFSKYNLQYFLGPWSFSSFIQITYVRCIHYIWHSVSSLLCLPGWNFLSNSVESTVLFTVLFIYHLYRDNFFFYVNKTFNDQTIIHILKCLHIYIIYVYLLYIYLNDSNNQVN